MGKEQQQKYTKNRYNMSIIYTYVIFVFSRLALYNIPLSICHVCTTPTHNPIMRLLYAPYTSLITVWFFRSFVFLFCLNNGLSYLAINKYLSFLKVVLNSRMSSLSITLYLVVSLAISLMDISSMFSLSNSCGNLSNI